MKKLSKLQLFLLSLLVTALSLVYSGKWGTGFVGGTGRGLPMLFVREATWTDDLGHGIVDADRVAANTLAAASLIVDVIFWFAALLFLQFVVSGEFVKFLKKNPFLYVLFIAIIISVYSLLILPFRISKKCLSVKNDYEQQKRTELNLFGENAAKNQILSDQVWREGQKIMKDCKSSHPLYGIWASLGLL